MNDDTEATAMPSPAETQEKKFVWEDNNTFGYDLVKDKERIDKLRQWYKCSFCGRPSEVRPHAPLLNDDWMNWKFFPIRLCFYCASIQENVREMCISVFKKDGN